MYPHPQQFLAHRHFCNHMFTRDNNYCCNHPKRMLWRCDKDQCPLHLLTGKQHIKLLNLSLLEDEVNQFIWDVLTLWLIENRVTLDNPIEWEYTGGNMITFTGTDKGRRVSMIIPLPAFDLNGYRARIGSVSGMMKDTDHTMNL